MNIEYCFMRGEDEQNHKKEFKTLKIRMFRDCNPRRWIGSLSELSGVVGGGGGGGGAVIFIFSELPVAQSSQEVPAQR